MINIGRMLQGPDMVGRAGPDMVGRGPDMGGLMVGYVPNLLGRIRTRYEVNQ